jgi:hypothetical protein
LTRTTTTCTCKRWTLTRTPNMKSSGASTMACTTLPKSWRLWRHPQSASRHVTAELLVRSYSIGIGYHGQVYRKRGSEKKLDQVGFTLFLSDMKKTKTCPKIQSFRDFKW